MKKFALVMCAALAGMSVFAGEWTLKDWLKDLDARIRRTEDKRKTGLVAAASVRGAKQDDDARKLYWKGRKEAHPVSAEELEAFKAAVAQAEQGKSVESQAALDSFMKKYPSSALQDDAKKTLVLLKTSSTPGAAAPAPEAKPVGAK